jgi:hypothetical protein
MAWQQGNWIEGDAVVPCQRRVQAWNCTGRSGFFAVEVFFIYHLPRWCTTGACHSHHTSSARAKSPGRLVLFAQMSRVSKRLVPLQRCKFRRNCQGHPGHYIAHHSLLRLNLLFPTLSIAQGLSQGCYLLLIAKTGQSARRNICMLAPWLGTSLISKQTMMKRLIFRNAQPNPAAPRPTLGKHRTASGIPSTWAHRIQALSVQTNLSSGIAVGTPWTFARRPWGIGKTTVQEGSRCLTNLAALLKVIFKQVRGANKSLNHCANC